MSLGYTTGCSEGPTLVGLTSVVTGTSVVVTARFTSSSALILKADQKIVVLNNATRGLANMFAPNANFVTYPAMTATPAPTNDYSVVFTLPPLEGPATYVMGWDSGTWVDSKGNAASGLDVKKNLYGFTIVTRTTNCIRGSTWSSTGLSPCTPCSTCLESGFTSVCNSNTDAVCSTAVQQRSATTVNLALVAAGSVSDYNEQRKTNLQIKFALAAGVPPSFVVVQVAAGSVIITAVIAVPVGSTASGITNALTTELGSTLDASSFLGITVTSAPTFTTTDNSRNTGTGNSLALPLGLGLGLGLPLGLGLVLSALYVFIKRREGNHKGKVPPITPIAQAAERKPERKPQRRHRRKPCTKHGSDR